MLDFPLTGLEQVAKHGDACWCLDDILCLLKVHGLCPTERGIRNYR